MADTPEKTISAAGFPVCLHGTSAIDSYLCLPNQSKGSCEWSGVQVLCGAGLTDLARLFEGLRYPGAALASAAVDHDGKTWYFQCEDAIDLHRRRHSFAFLDFYQDCATRRFYDPNGIYPFLRQIRDGVKYGNGEAGVMQWWKDVNINSDICGALFDAAVILARYFSPFSLEGADVSKKINVIAAQFPNLDKVPPPTVEEQRLLLIRLLEAANPAPGFELLKKCGFIAAYWPELAVLDDVDHSKEFHPEGNVWMHTIETLRYRKPSYRRQTARQGFDLRLSLGLLLHDIGKPLAETSGSRRFNGHAELGEHQARRFLRRLGFESQLVHDVCYLVRNHMLPAALPRLPLIRTGEIMSSLLFPILLELYRCDESSSFKGLNGYYKSAAAYQSFLKHRKNPAKK